MGLRDWIPVNRIRNTYLHTCYTGVYMVTVWWRGVWAPLAQHYMIGETGVLELLGMLTATTPQGSSHLFLSERRSSETEPAFDSIGCAESEASPCSPLQKVYGCLETRYRDTSISLPFNTDDTSTLVVVLLFLGSPI